MSANLSIKMNTDSGAKAENAVLAPASQSVTLVLGRMPHGADPETHWAAGPWCFAGQEDFFPDWEDRYVFGPEPLRDPRAVEQAAREAQALCVDHLAALAARICPHSADLPSAYWETLLAPWAIDVARQIVERWGRVRAMTEAWGHLPLRVPLLPADCSFSFRAEHDFTLRGALGHSFNHWLFSRLLEARWPQKWHKEILPPVHKDYGQKSPADPRTGLRQWVLGLMLRLPFPHLKGMSLGQSLRFSLALLHKSRGEDRSRPLTDFSAKAAGGHGSLRADGQPHPLPLDPMPLFLAALPRSLIRLKHPERLKPGLLAPRLRVASVLAYEDAVYRQRLAVWRGRGNRLMYVQHGGNYGQVRVACDAALVEYSQHAFGTWGWSEHAGSRGNFIPLPYPQIARMAGRWHGQPGRHLLFVGTEMPMYGYRLDAHPTPLQFVQYREDKQWFFEALGRALQNRAFYRPYFDLPGTMQDADWLLARFPRVRLATGPLTPLLLSCRLLVLDHHGTTMLEALAANVPTLMYWDREIWPLTQESEALLDVLARAGIWHATAEEAAAKANQIWEDPCSWWHSAAVQDARRTYCALQALMVKGSENPYWIQTLKSL